jgi:hypothetical protein
MRRMAGTKEGIAKARAAAAAKRAAYAGQPQSAQSDNPGAYQEHDPNSATALVAAPVAPVGPVECDAGNVTVARQAVSQCLLPAVDVLHKIITGRLRAPVAVRGAMAVRMLEMGGVPVDKSTPAEPPRLTAEGRARLERVLALRRASVGAESVVPQPLTPEIPSQD